MNKIQLRFGLIAGLIFLAALSRILPHPYNFSPLVAMALFGGAHFKQKWQAYIIPLAAFFISDVFFALIGNTGFYGISQVFVYGSMLLVTALGTTMQQPRVLKVLGYSLSGSAIFWIISNFGVWLANYAAAGTATHEAGLTLGMTYLRALPFYNVYSNQLFFGSFAGDLFYTGLLFGLYALLQQKYPALRYSGNQ